MGHKWVNHEKQLNAFVSTLSKSTIVLQEKTQKAHLLSSTVDKILRNLKKCPLIKKIFTNKILQLQKIVDQLDDGGFHNVPYWSNMLCKKLDVILLSRVDEVLEDWLLRLDEDWSQDYDSDEDDDESKEEDQERDDDDDISCLVCVFLYSSIITNLYML